MNHLSSNTSNDACTNIVQTLLRYRKVGEMEQFAKKAIESLVKKLREKKEDLQALITAVTRGGAQATPCITIQRTLDGRLQVAGRKGFPHVIYTKIWRWPDLHRSELKHLDICKYGFDLKRDSVCVNPYHYRRVISPEIDLAGLTMQHVAPATPLLSIGNGNMSPYSSPSISINEEVARYPTNSHTTKRQLNLLDTPEFISSRSSEADSVLSAFDRISSDNVDENIMLPRKIPRHTVGISSRCYSNESDLGDAQLPNYPLPEFWCTMTSYEMDVQVGESFKVPNFCLSVTVDGYVDPSVGNRFCLGQLTNVHRTAASEKTRMHIGKGIRLVKRGQGDVWMKCLSNFPVFVQSYYLDYEVGHTPGDAVHKIYPEAHVKVFDLNQCYTQIQRVVTAKASATALSPENNNSSNHLRNFMPSPVANIGVDDLRKLCILRVSFLKGWGPGYFRKRIVETPCWIEIQLHRALQLLDEILLTMPVEIQPED